jgi:selenocysteine-specific elongation factor
MVAGSFLEGAPIVPVSSTTGAGLGDLRRELTRVASSAGEKNAAGWFRLPVDRTFTIKGFGTVVTGTLISGSVEKDQEVEVYPSGRRLRVRGVEVHGTQGRAVAGQRTAVNLADVEPSEICRGDVLSAPGRFRAVTQVDCRLQLLGSSKPLKHRAPVHFHSGTAEIEGEVRLLDGRAALVPGAAAYARIVLREPALLLPGDRFIIRRFSPVVTIGGGTVIDLPKQNRERSGAAISRLDALSSPDIGARLDFLIQASAYGLALDDLIARTGLTAPEIFAARKPMLDNWWVHRPWFQSASGRLVHAVREFHAANPLRPGIPKQDLCGRDLAGIPLFVLDALLASAKELVIERDLVRLRTHTVRLKEDEEQARAAIERAFEAAGLAVPAVGEVLAASGVEASRARTLMQILLREGKLVRITADLIFHQSAIGRLRDLLALRKSERFNVAAFKEWTGVSRKYAIPLLEFLDREHVTRRAGDERVIL